MNIQKFFGEKNNKKEWVYGTFEHGIIRDYGQKMIYYTDKEGKRRDYPISELDLEKVKVVNKSLSIFTNKMSKARKSVY
ncbi:MAG: hypothetical protein GY828_06660 [Candidatus Gracilibacteria bacterium]|nr:hypothetical protein [Candidatus Gracilibacteria bacterium]